MYLMFFSAPLLYLARRVIRFAQLMIDGSNPRFHLPLQCRSGNVDIGARTGEMEFRQFIIKLFESVFNG